MQARAAAARVVDAVIRQRESLDLALARWSERVPPADRGLLQELSYGTLRWQPRLAALAGQLLHRPLRERDGDVGALLLVGLYQLLYTRIPAHAAVAETVAGASVLRKRWAANLLNASLRRWQREGETLAAALDGDAQATSAHPAWLLGRLQQAWPGEWPALVAANNARPPLTLRVNLARVTREAYLEQLLAAGLAGQPVAQVPSALTLDTPCEVARLPGFAAGLVSVQDAAAQFAATLLEPQPGQRVLDACAAPGGKTGHLLELQPGLAGLVALDRSAARLERVRENLDRLGATARLVAADATEPVSWWDGRPFERILLDAPCSGSGVIRRHPDIKLLRRPQDVAGLVAEQARLLAALWPLLAPGGVLLYATCSVLPEENESQISAFLATQGEARERVIDAGWGVPRRHGRQVLTGEQGMDGFYYARLQRPG